MDGLGPQKGEYYGKNFHTNQNQQRSGMQSEEGRADRCSGLAGRKAAAAKNP